MSEATFTSIGVGYALSQGDDLTAKAPISSALSGSHFRSRNCIFMPTLLIHCSSFPGIFIVNVWWRSNIPSFCDIKQLASARLLLAKKGDQPAGCYANPEGCRRHLSRMRLLARNASPVLMFLISGAKRVRS